MLILFKIAATIVLMPLAAIVIFFATAMATVLIGSIVGTFSRFLRG